MKRSFSWHFYAVLLLIISITATVYTYFIKHEEYAYEMADLQAMNNALTAAQIEMLSRFHALDL